MHIKYYSLPGTKVTHYLLHLSLEIACSHALANSSENKNKSHAHVPRMRRLTPVAVDDGGVSPMAGCGGEVLFVAGARARGDGGGPLELLEPVS